MGARARLVDALKGVAHDANARGEVCGGDRRASSSGTDWERFRTNGTFLPSLGEISIAQAKLLGVYDEGHAVGPEPNSVFAHRGDDARE